MQKQIFFFIGTEAELIKIFPVIIECQNRGKTCHVISSGQNNIRQSRIMEFVKLNGKFVELSDEKDITKNAKGLIKWFFITKRNAVEIIGQNFDGEELKGANLLVHGDTVSTFMGALIGKKLKMTVCHVEAGLRSHHLFNPFPEEIDRLLTSRLARLHFAPGKEAEQNLRKVKGKVINTKYNTILDSLNFSKTVPIITESVGKILHDDYFVFVMHRQENLMNKDFVKSVMERICCLAEQRKCVLLLHKITENALREMGIMSSLQENPNIILMPRLDYFDFMKLLAASRFVITDGGSNQEELHYMGKPCLIMRKTTERREGIGTNARMYDGTMSCITSFAANYEEHKIKSLIGLESPSSIIANILSV